MYVLARRLESNGKVLDEGGSHPCHCNWLVTLGQETPHGRFTASANLFRRNRLDLTKMLEGWVYIQPRSMQRNGPPDRNSHAG